MCTFTEVNLNKKRALTIFVILCTPKFKLFCIHVRDVIFCVYVTIFLSVYKPSFSNFKNKSVNGFYFIIRDLT